MQVAELPIRFDRAAVARFCQERGIRRLSLFGSVLRDDFDPNRSDVDVLAELSPESRPGWEFFGWHEDLRELLGRKVDLHTPNSLSRYFREAVLQEAVPIHEQA